MLSLFSLNIVKTASPARVLAAGFVSMASVNQSSSPVLKIERLSWPLSPPDPFLFTAYHKDMYPAGNARMEAPRRGDGSDFDPSKPYRMYHGERIPGFPQHPHRGFETLTAVMEGNCDHTDSLGNAGRFGGDGDLQWMTAGSGCVHGENFPLINQDGPNTLRLFQIWLNLPKKNKMASPGYIMHWSEKLAKVQGPGGAVVRVFAGRLGDLAQGQTPPPDSWASDEKNDVAVFYVSLPRRGGAFTLPPAVQGADINRSLYVTEGRKVFVAGQEIGPSAVTVRGDAPVELRNEDSDVDVEVLVLQGRPIKEAVVQHGPFVMNTRAEIEQTFAEYRRTQFGGWPWPEDAVVFPRDKGRFSSKKIGGQTVTELPPASA